MLYLLYFLTLPSSPECKSSVTASVTTGERAFKLATFPEPRRAEPRRADCTRRNGAWRVSNETWPADPNYFGHRFSNGLVYAEKLAEMLDIPIQDSGDIAGLIKLSHAADH